jgi:hypothetical protein
VVTEGEALRDRAIIRRWVIVAMVSAAIWRVREATANPVPCPRDTANQALTTLETLRRFTCTYAKGRCAQFCWRLPL